MSPRAGKQVGKAWRSGMWEAGQAPPAAACPGGNERCASTASLHQRQEADDSNESERSSASLTVVGRQPLHLVNRRLQSSTGCCARGAGQQC